MNTYEITYQQLKDRFEQSGKDVQGFVAPLIALCDDSSTLIVGYSGGEIKIREDLIPYFHLVGHRLGQEPLRALLIGSWVGGESPTSLAVARLVAALEGRVTLAQGMEVTAYPVANLAAYREGKAEKDPGKLWQDSELAHVPIFEREVQRYSYDLILNFHVDPKASDLVVEGWAEGDVRSKVFSDPLSRFGDVAPAFKWTLNPEKAQFARVFTPVPGRKNDQPVEVAIGLPGKLSTDEQTAAALKISLSLLHQFRQARVEGLL